MADITVSQGIYVTRAALSPASQLAAKKRAREKRMYQTAEGLKDEDEFGDMLINALTSYHPADAVVQPAETDRQSCSHSVTRGTRESNAAARKYECAARCDDEGWDAGVPGQRRWRRKRSHRTRSPCSSTQRSDSARSQRQQREDAHPCVDEL